MRTDTGGQATRAERFWRWGGPLCFSSALGIVFGRADYAMEQRGPLLFAVANIASLWLALAFLVGLTARSRSHAVLCGGVALLAALFGFYDAVHLSSALGLFRTLHESKHWLEAALLLGPLYGLLGYAWNARQAWYAAFALVAAFLIEPIVWLGGLHPAPPRLSVCLLEGATGVALAFALLCWRIVARVRA